MNMKLPVSWNHIDSRLRIFPKRFRDAFSDEPSFGLNVEHVLPILKRLILTRKTASLAELQTFG